MTVESAAGAVNLLSCGGIAYVVWRYWSDPDHTDFVVDVATTIGVLGTFLGIFIGLFDFNPRNLEASVPKLLEGLKTAFLTSIAGMTAAMIMKLRTRWVLKQRGAPSSDANPEVIQRQILATLSEHARQSAAKMAAIENAIVGDGETTIHTQILKIRTTLLDKNDELIREFRSFAAMMAKSNSEALIEALKEVIKDFNAKINEQFGENFKELNAAVGKLLEWQRQYKEHVERITAQCETTMKAVESARNALDDISQKSGAYTESAKGLEKLLVEAHGSVAQFAKIAEDARTAIPQVLGVVDDTTKKLTKALESTATMTESTTRTHNEAIAKQLQAIASAAEKVNLGVDQTMQNTSKNIQRLVDENQQLVSKKIDDLDRMLGEELKKSISSLGTQLASLSGKFVEDYTPLTNRLRELVEIAGRVRTDGNGN